MRIGQLSAVTILLFVSAAPVALAQDMERPFNGLYAGLNGGYDFGKNNVSTSGQSDANSATLADGARPATVKMDPEGFLGGVQIGHNWQMDHYVFGLEGDAQYTDTRDTRTLTTTGTAFPGIRNNQFRQDMTYLATARARLGYAWDNSMVYGTGGYAFGHLKEAVDFSGPLPTATPQFSSFQNRTNVGYVAGAGFEQFLDSNWSIKTEYLYYDLGRNQQYPNMIAGSGGAGLGYASSFNNKGQIARIGINYRID